MDPKAPKITQYDPANPARWLEEASMDIQDAGWASFVTPPAPAGAANAQNGAPLVGRGARRRGQQGPAAGAAAAVLLTARAYIEAQQGDAEKTRLRKEHQQCIVAMATAVGREFRRLIPPADADDAALFWDFVEAKCRLTDEVRRRKALEDLAKGPKVGLGGVAWEAYVGELERAHKEALASQAQDDLMTAAMMASLADYPKMAEIMQKALLQKPAATLSAACVLAQVKALNATEAQRLVDQVGESAHAAAVASETAALAANEHKDGGGGGGIKGVKGGSGGKRGGGHKGAKGSGRGGGGTTCYLCSQKGHIRPECPLNAQVNAMILRQFGASREGGGSGQAAAGAAVAHEVNEEERYDAEALPAMHVSSHSLTPHVLPPFSTHAATSSSSKGLARNSTNTDKVPILDSGASAHMFACESDFTALDKSAASTARKVKVADGRTLKVAGIGAIRLSIVPPLELQGVLFVPELRANLLSVSRLAQDGVGVLFRADGASLVHQNHATLLAHMHDGLYRLGARPLAIPNPSVAGSVERALRASAVHSREATSHEIQLLHRRVGHIGLPALRAAYESGAVEGFPAGIALEGFGGADEICVGCIAGKHHREAVPKEAHPAEHALHIVHIDLCGPFPVASIVHGYRYFMVAVDGYSRYVYIAGLVNKDAASVAKAFERFQQAMQTQVGRSIRCVRTDNGAEFLGEFTELLRKTSIVHDRTAPYTPAQNGMAERMNQAIQHGIISMLEDQKLPQELWWEAASTWVMARNRVKIIKVKRNGKAVRTTPYTYIYSRASDISMFRVFGSACYPLIPAETRSKGVSHTTSAPCYYLGPQPNTKGHRLWSPSENRIIVAESVQFMENGQMTAMPLQVSMQANRDIVIGPSRQVAQPAGASTVAQRFNAALNKPPAVAPVLAWAPRALAPGIGPALGPQLVQAPAAPASALAPASLPPAAVSLPIATAPAVVAPAALQVPKTKPTATRQPRAVMKWVQMPRTKKPTPIVTYNRFTPLSQDGDAPATETQAAGLGSGGSKTQTNRDGNVPEAGTPAAGIGSGGSKRPAAPPTTRHPHFTRSKDWSAAPAPGPIDAAHPIAAMKASAPTVETEPDGKDDVGERFPPGLKEEEDSEVIDMKDARDDKEWQAAIKREVDGHIERGTFEFMEHDERKNIIPGMWILTRKRDENKTKKARFVAKGFRQRYGRDFKETYAPTSSYDGVRLFCAISATRGHHLHHVDVCQAFLNAHLQEEVYMHPPEFFPIPEALQGKRVMVRVWRALYGLRQAPRAWYHEIKRTLQAMGFNPTAADETIYVKDKETDNKEIGPTFILLYVDDLLISCSSPETLKRIKKALLKRYKIKDNGEVRCFLGIKIIRDWQRKKIFLSQPTHVDRVIATSGVENEYPVAVPLLQSVKLTQEGNRVKKGELSADNKTLYRSLLGQLLHLSRCTRPDIALAVGRFARYNQDPAPDHLEGLTGVVRYLKGSKGLVLTLGEARTDKRIDLVGYSDADLAAEPDQRRSTTGYAFQAFGGLISWKSKLQQTVATSTTESEYQGITTAAKESQYLRQVLEGIGLPVQGPTALWGDNQAAIALVKNPGHRDRTKHFATALRYVQQLQERGLIDVNFVPSALMIADIFTKPLPRPKFEADRARLGLICLDGDCLSDMA